VALAQPYREAKVEAMSLLSETENGR